MAVEPKNEVPQTPEKWLDADPADATESELDAPFRRADDPDYDRQVRGALAEREAEHVVLTSLHELRRMAQLTQVDVAKLVARPQTNISRLESDPSRATVATLASYVRAVGGHLRVEAEVGGETYSVELA